VSAANTTYHPVKFLDELEGNRHIVLLYDNQELGDLMVARYFLNGWKKEESCIFFSDEDPGPMEEYLRSQGIDLGKYKDALLYRSYRTRPPRADMEVLQILRTIRADAVRGMRGPFRFAGRTIMDIETTRGMLQGMEVERTGQEHFPEFDNAQLCFYDIRKLEPTRKREWIRGLLENHDQIIYATSPDKAVGFDTALLREDE
jgi:MEDS: MEthanogen/methylotroph, DcmR Sensory domain